jgi:glycosyltransferase involved in cell wall biosynthesis
VTGQHNFGVAVTTHNRPALLAECLSRIVKHTPDAVPLVVVDDGCAPPAQVPAEYNATIVRHPIALGVPAAKNACIEALMDEDVEHLFLFDDDTWPVADDWWVPYVDGAEPHYQYCWQKFKNGNPVALMQEVYRDPGLVGYGHSMGCMLYLHRSVVQRVGGLDLRFGLGVEEHIEYSQRIHNADLTTFVGQDVPGSGELFYASDEHGATVSSIERPARLRQLETNRALRLSLIDSDRYVSFRHPRDVVLAFYSTRHRDVQDGRKGQRWPADPQRLYDLARSVGPLSGRLVVFHDCFREGQLEYENHPVPTPLSPYNQRWITKYQYLRDHPEVRYAFCVDSTDVTMLQNPFPHMQPDTLYCGWETTVVGHDWVQRHCESVKDWVDAHQHEMLLNCGVVGGDRNTLMRLCRRMIDMWANYGGDPLQETVWFNIVAREFGSKLETGPRVTTAFKMRHTSDPHAWFCHK